MTKAIAGQLPSKPAPHRSPRRSALWPLWLLLWPLTQSWKLLYRHFLAYILGHVVRDKKRIYAIRFVWYGDSVYLHPMIWGGLALYFVAQAGVLAPGWLLLIWLVLLFACLMTVMYDFDVVKSSVLLVSILALMGAVYFSTMEFAWNPLFAVAGHVRSLGAQVTPGFYLLSAYMFALLISGEILWAWLFHRVEIDESYVYEHQFLKGTIREPIFARGLKRETADLMELLVLGAADIQHRTKQGSKRFRNVPFASLWLGTALDSMLDFRRAAQVDMEQGEQDDATDVRVSDALGSDAEDDSDQQDDEDDGQDDGQDDRLA